MELLVVGILIAGLFAAGYGPSHSQEPDATAEVTQALELGPAMPGRLRPEVVPIVTRAGAHDDFGRIVFDWPRAVAYGARIEEKTLTVMFDRHLRTNISRRFHALLVRMSPLWTSVPTATVWSPP